MGLHKVVQAYKLGREYTKLNVFGISKIEENFKDAYKYLNLAYSLDVKRLHFHKIESILDGKSPLLKTIFNVGRWSNPLDYILSEFKLSEYQKKFS